MKAKIYDVEKRPLRTETGEFKKATFVYTVGQIDLKLFKIGGTEKTLPCDYTKTYQINKNEDKTAFYIFDGKDYKQITPDKLNNVPAESNDKSIINVLDQDTIAEGVEKEMLPKPFDLNTLIPLILIALGLIEVIACYFMINHGYALATQSYAPVNDTLHLTSRVCTNEFAVCSNTSKALTACISRLGGNP